MVKAKNRTYHHAGWLTGRRECSSASSSPLLSLAVWALWCWQTGQESSGSGQNCCCCCVLYNPSHHLRGNRSKWKVSNKICTNSRGEKKVDFLPVTLTFPYKNRLTSSEQHAIRWSNYCSGPVMLSLCSCTQNMIHYTSKFSLCTIKVILHFCCLCS